MSDGLFVPPGHFYSPIPGQDEIDRYRRLAQQPVPDNIPAVDLNQAEQTQNLLAMIAEYHALPAFPAGKTAGLRYYYLNPEFAYQDAIALRYFLRRYRPRRVVEVGCGYTSACMLDTADADALPTEFTFVEPYPERLLENMTDPDKVRCSILVQKLQDVDLYVFTRLEAHDVLFIDSSHVAKLCSDVNWYMFEILPRLASGVVVHIHDINYPFSDPAHFVDQGRAWTESYLLRAFLMYNTTFRIIAWNPYYSLMQTELLTQMPLCIQYGGGSFWMRKS